MKKTLVFIFAFVAFLSFAQNKINFTKQIEYGFVSKEKGKMPSLYFKTLGNSNGEFLTQSQFSYFPMNFFTDNSGSMTVSIGLGNKLNYSIMGSYFGGNIYDDNIRIKNLTAKKLVTSETVLGISCNHYLISFSKDKDADDYGSKKNDNIKVCMNERNALNNYNILLGASSLFDNTNLNGDKLKGLILKFGSEKNYDEEYLVAKSIKNIKETVYFDHKAALEKQKKERDSLIAKREESEAKWKKEEAAYDTASVAVDSAYATAVDSAAADYEDSYSYLEKYQSSYKKDQHGNGTYAIDNIPSEKAWNALPSYCKNPSKDLQKLQDAEFVKHLKNYSSQICDIYLAQSRDHNVDIKGTMDEIRREVLYINDRKEKLSKEDQKKVSKYLEKFGLVETRFIASPIAIRI